MQARDTNMQVRAMNLRSKENHKLYPKNKKFSLINKKPIKNAFFFLIKDKKKAFFLLHFIKKMFKSLLVRFLEQRNLAAQNLNNL